MTKPLAEALADAGIKLRSTAPGQYYTTCPNCSHNRKPANRSKPCLSVKLDHDGGFVAFCQNCEWKTNHAGTRSGRGYTRDREPRVWKPAAKPPARPARPQAMLDWFKSRGVPEEIVEQEGIYATKRRFPQDFHLGQRPDNTIDWDKVPFTPCIAFPYRVKGEVVNHKYRDRGKRFCQDTGARRSLYGLDSIIDDDMVIFVEGEIDRLVLLGLGYQQVVSLPDGAPQKPKDEDDPSREDDKRFEALVDALEKLRPVKKIVIGTDMDGPGRILAEEFARRLGKERCWRAQWPKKDAGDTFTELGADAVHYAIESAIGYPVNGIYQLERGTLLDLRQSPKQKLYSTGWPELDEFIKVPLGWVSIVTGIPSSGKSEFIDALTVNLAMRYGWRFAMFSAEKRMDEHAAALAEKFMGIPFQTYGQWTKAMTDFEVQQAEAWVNQHYVFIRSETNAQCSLDWILDRAELAVVRHGIRGLVIDPYNEIEHVRRPGQSETEYISECLTKVRRFAARYDIHVWFIAHPMKLAKENGKVPVPGLYEISGGAHWYNKADIGVTVHRPNKDSFDAEIYITKRRLKQWGKLGMVTLVWDPQTGRYGPRP
jgi:twinkle protein